MATADLESAIAPHLQVSRTCPARMPEGYKPQFPAYCARFSPSVRNMVMAIVGAQHTNADAAKSTDALSKILTFMKGSAKDSPKHCDLASVTDNKGFYNETVIAYWDDVTSYEAWRTGSDFGKWWTSLDPTTEAHGWFQEIFMPSMDRVETIYSDAEPDRTPEGHGAMSEHLSGTVQEHVYWGSMRDRLPASQTNELVGESASTPASTADTRTSRVKVLGKQNLCVIRSGQDWSRTSPDERKLYLDTMHPVLIEGMSFLRDKGSEVGCYSCRFMNLLDPIARSSDTDQTFGLAYFDDIANLEKWSKEHRTHLNIFGGFLGYVKKLNFQVTLHLYHEVFVLKPEQQVFEYVGCHGETGLLGKLGEIS